MDNEERPPGSPPRSRFARSIARWLAWLNRQPMVVFTLVLAACSVLVQIVPILLIVTLELTGRSLPTLNVHYSILTVLVAAPLLETFLGQWLPIWVTSRFTRKAGIQMAVSAIVFSLLHLPDVQQALQIAPGALAMAYTYITWRGRGRHKGYWATALMHFWANGIAVLANSLL